MMGESTSCILRPLSQPASAALESNQGDHIRALTSSVSFGRYVSETLAWEKWSTFTHNRYKEEAERYAKPGSVAQMKAYFEAHYKKKAADRAAELNGQQNCGSNLKLVLETETKKLPLMEQDLVPRDSHVGTGETGEDVVTTQDVIVIPIELSRCTPCEKVRGAEDAQIPNDESSLADPVATTDQHNLVEDTQLCGSIFNSEQKVQKDTLAVKAEEPLFADREDVGNPVLDLESLRIDTASEHNKMLINAVGESGDSGSLDKDKSMILSTKSRSHTVVPKPPVPPKPPVSLQKRKDTNAKLDRKRTADKDKLTILSTKSSSHTVVPKPAVPPKPPVSLQKRKHNNVKQDRKGTASDIRDKKGTMSRLLRLPRNSANETKKPMSPILEKILNSKLMKTLAGNASKVSRGKPVKDSVEIPLHAAATIPDRKVSYRSPLHQSISSSGKEDAMSQSPFVGRSKSPGAHGREARPPIVARALSFKTEERAAKRKEFYERLEQKSKIQMTEKDKLQEQTKEKARSDPMQKSESSKTSINAMKKVSTALPCSPTVGRKTPSKLQDNSSRLPRYTTTLSCSATVSTRIQPNLEDKNSRSPWKHSTLAFLSSAGTKIPSEHQNNISRSPWKYTTHPCSSSTGTKTPSQLQDNISRSPWNHTAYPCSSSAGTETPSKLQDNNSRSPWRSTTLPSSSSVDRKTPSKMQDNNSRPPWRLTPKSKCSKETIEKNNKSPYHLERSGSKKSAHENSSPNIQLSRER